MYIVHFWPEHCSLQLRLVPAVFVFGPVLSSCLCAAMYSPDFILTCCGLEVKGFHMPGSSTWLL